MDVKTLPRREREKLRLREDLLAAALELFSESGYHNVSMREIAAVAAGSFREKKPPRITGSGYVVHSLEAALWAFHDAQDFREAVLRAVNPKVEIIAVQAEKSPAAWLSWKQGRMVEADSTSIALVIALGHAFPIPFEIYKDGLSDFILLSDEEILDGIGLSWYYTHNLVESAGAVTMAALFKLRQRLQGKRVVLQMSGGNAPVAEIMQAVRRPTVSEGFQGATP